MARYKRRIYDDTTPSLFDDTRPEPPAHTGLRLPADRSAGIASDIFEICGAPTQAPATGVRCGIEPLSIGRGRDVLRFISFGSGSSGNCAYLGDDKDGIIIDAGIEGKQVASELARHGIAMTQIRGVIITHDHGDHVRYLYSILRRNKTIPLYCTPRTLNGMLRRHSMSRRVSDYHHAIYKEIPFKAGDMEITAFEVHHDGSDNVGFSIRLRGHTFVVATDLGCVGERAMHYISDADYLMVEANYDRTMLINGSRPEYLKARILGTHGHLDNNDTASLLRRIYTPRLRNVFLCHLSEDNNTPELALDTARNALLEAGAADVGDGSGSLTAVRAPVQLVALPRFTATPVYTLSLK